MTAVYVGRILRRMTARTAAILAAYSTIRTVPQPSRPLTIPELRALGAARRRASIDARLAPYTIQRVTRVAA